MHSSSELTIQDAGSQTGGHDWPSCQLLVKATKSAMDIEISQGVSKMLELELHRAGRDNMLFGRVLTMIKFFNSSPGSVLLTWK